MGFRAKIFAVLAALGLFPAAILGWLSFSVNRAELETSVGASQTAVAEEVARGTERFVLQAVTSLRLSASLLPLGELSPRELEKVLHIPYRQLDFLDGVELLSASGAPLSPAIFESGNGRPAPLVDALLRGAPLALAAKAGTAIGAPYAGAEGPVRLPIALQLEHGELLVAELSLSKLQEQMQQNSRGGAVALLATQAGGLLASGEKFDLGDGDKALLRKGTGVALLQRKDGSEWLASAAPVTALGWTVLIAQPAKIALRPAAVVRDYTLFWLGVAAILVVVLGAMLARRVTDPIQRLQVSVQALLQGRADEAKVESDDEIGQFAKAFNAMAGQIVKRDEEIRRWNTELQQRVEERTAELKVAQDQILRARRLAALGSMGAGIAHELNNPLTSIAGLASILSLDLQGSPHEVTLKTLQGEVKRAAKIVTDMRKLTEQESAQAGAQVPARQQGAGRAGVVRRRAEGAQHQAHLGPRAVRDPGRPGADSAGGGEPGRERHPRHAPRRRAARVALGRRRRGLQAHRQRHRQGHSGRHARAHLRPVLHHQRRAHRRRHGAAHLAPHRRGAPREAHLGERRRPWRDLHHRPSRGCRGCPSALRKP